MTTDVPTTYPAELPKLPAETVARLRAAGWRPPLPALAGEFRRAAWHADLDELAQMVEVELAAARSAGNWPLPGAGAQLAALNEPAERTVEIILDWGNAIRDAGYDWPTAVYIATVAYYG